jgi:hypothetical protein
MSKNIANVSIDETHSMAICTEIGERLQWELKAGAPMPPKLTMLLARLSELDFHESPSMVPSMETDSLELA